MNPYDKELRRWVLDSAPSVEDKAKLASLPVEMLLELHPEFHLHGPQPIKMQRLLAVMETCKALITVNSQGCTASQDWMTFVTTLNNLSLRSSYIHKLMAVKGTSQNFYRARWLLDLGVLKDFSPRSLQGSISELSKLADPRVRLNEREFAAVTYLSLVDKTLGVTILPRSTITATQAAYRKLVVAQKEW